MKRVIQFHKAFLPAAIVSIALILFGLVGLATKGINLGVDFQAGVNQSVRLAYPAAEVSYAGSGTPVLSISESEVTVVFSGAQVVSRTATWKLATVGTIADLAVAMRTEGIEVSVFDGAGLSADLVVPTYQGDYALGTVPVIIHRMPKSTAEVFGSIEQIRKAVESVGSASVQNIGPASSMQYLIRVRDDGKDPAFSGTVPGLIRRALESIYGANKVIAMKTDYVGARFSKDLATNSWKLTLFTVLAILAYATIRFKMQYAMGAVLAIIHDGLIMVGFIVWSRMEFNTTSIAAILTILGYSINDTIVIFDRIREDRKLDTTAKLSSILDKSITETLGRTIITTLTTMLAVFSLYFFTSGSIKDFALALLVGMVSGTYSTVFVASGFVQLWENIRVKRQPKPAAAPAHHAAKS
ncbi:MAG: protein translocase subunit SecF [Spirochaetae bacterium HGW-Spirochaetae-7]|jgi:preprotein translocase subunit SecF|nr:MAG: protein translocase subunit SecF [Spirochaetae bacterium HGW-Spirochaetae-7]